MAGRGGRRRRRDATAISRATRAKFGQVPARSVDHSAGEASPEMCRDPGREFTSRKLNEDPQSFLLRNRGSSPPPGRRPQNRLGLRRTRVGRHRVAAVRLQGISFCSVCVQLHLETVLLGEEPILGPKAERNASTRSKRAEIRPYAHADQVAAWRPGWSQRVTDEIAVVGPTQDSG